MSRSLSRMLYQVATVVLFIGLQLHHGSDKPERHVAHCSRLQISHEHEGHVNPRALRAPSTSSEGVLDRPNPETPSQTTGARDAATKRVWSRGTGFWNRPSVRPPKKAEDSEDSIIGNWRGPQVASSQAPRGAPNNKQKRQKKLVYTRCLLEDRGAHDPLT